MKQKLQELMAKGLPSEEIITALTGEGHEREAIVKALEEEGVSEEDMNKALALLDDLEKSGTDDSDDMDALLKALEEEEARLAKSGCDDEGGEEEDEDGGDEGFEKSEADDALDELVKASQLYEEMTSEIRKSHGDTMGQLQAMHKMGLAQSNLLIKTARAVAEMAKSVQQMAAAPGSAGRGVLGLGSQEQEVVKKSRSEIQSDLFRAVQEKRIDAIYLSTFAVRGADALPESVKKEIGL